MDAEGAFKAILLNISDELKDDNLSSLKFLCTGHIGKKKLEGVKSGIELFQYLKEVDKLGPDKTEVLHSILCQIKRDDLAAKLNELPKYATTDEKGTREQEKVKIAVEVIVENLGKDWKKYGRKLGLNDPKLDQIKEKHPFDLGEQVMEVITVWKKMRNEDVKADELIEALRLCKLNYTADLVEKEMENHGF